MSDDYTKGELEEITKNAFSRKSITLVDDEMIVVGKFCRAAYLGDGFWDVWVCNYKNLRDGLSTRKVNAIYGRISDLGADTGPLRRLDGEGYYQRMPTEVFLCSAPVLGVRKRAKSKGNIAALRRKA
jgi:hypothetical protein